jgi:ABC-type glycerol-3-phosphate transport system permease component
MEAEARRVDAVAHSVVDGPRVASRFAGVRSRSTVGTAFDVVNHLILASMALVCLVPFILVIVASFSSETSLETVGIWFVPKQWSTLAFEVISRSGNIVRAYTISVGVTVTGTSLGVLLMSAFAYTLASRRTRYRNQLSFYIYFTMLFSGGLLPWYIVTTRVLGLHDNFAALVVPMVLDPFWIFVLRNFFNTIPVDFVESARMDGASELTILWRIILPLSSPALATVGLFTAVRYWNDWWLGTILIDRSEIRPLSVLIMSLINSIEGVRAATERGATFNYQIPAIGIQMATVVIAIGPIVLLYPFLQRYFVQGLLIGGIKG